MANQKKTWKDHLLSSGLPLEQSVANTLESLGIMDPREYKYERTNENGIPTVFSVDLRASVVGNLWIDFFIECKYRHDNTKWIFTPNEYTIWRDNSFSDAFIRLDSLTRSKINHSYINKFSEGYPLCGKGVELINNDANPKSIEQAIQQLKYALVEETADMLIHQTDDLLGTKPPVFVAVPIIVTTAEIWRLNPKTTIEMIRSATELHEVAQPQELVLTEQSPDNELTKHTLKRFKERIGDSQMSNFNAKNKSPFHNYQHFLSFFSTYYPSYYFIVEYNHLEPALKSIITMFGDPEAVIDKDAV
jgi:hypothetical protein